ncbi:MAG: ABC transporter ATP-binding protein [bacterium]|nr:ABC transporter ATP-binding protein [bacterium]
MNHSNVVLSVQDLQVSYLTTRGRMRAVNHVSFDLHQGETLALIGESGCGKSTLNLSLIQLLPKTGVVDGGRVVYANRGGQQIDILSLRGEKLRRFRWAECAMVFQAALNSLNPVIRVRDMVLDTARAHGNSDTKAVTHRALELFRMVRLDPDRVFNAYPHQLSGGMRQRVLIALSVLLDPQVLLLDEPTTAVDILTQRTIIDVLKTLRRELGISMIFISHDLSIAAEMADTVATMYAGEIVEIGPVNDVFYRPAHAYTLGLMRAVPRLSTDREELNSIPGSPPDLIAPPPGCKFHPRCGFATDICKTAPPPAAIHATEDAFMPHQFACHHADRVMRDAQENPAHARAVD